MCSENAGECRHRDASRGLELVSIGGEKKIKVGREKYNSKAHFNFAGGGRRLLSETAADFIRINDKAG